ncbi:hypothetical protein PF005_g14313 [Phytophthora fragariae]|uniref:Uncharacterized protein n=1 Tax=Phytophthora fragariae TaxID=53985 RepID=A0A6A3XSB3_9STRA|nr:hypothetical protein PF003_g13295 [Phytophthora fragariae]KAE8927169.1 hypothetical protein PF009_g22652 [Phytophthora fragariae]KAE9102743.1 hypothetical protein PF010_g13998 [Phytophthora fragariae]KAE9102753.1 hypothetical protein PF007_g14639 [Phytophthora fragariae]KAE9140246.1 hypothetical protein PF006_g13566 [Phytophthora fragariae]
MLPAFLRLERSTLSTLALSTAIYCSHGASLAVATAAGSAQNNPTTHKASTPCLASSTCVPCQFLFVHCTCLLQIVSPAA